MRYRGALPHSGVQGGSHQYRRARSHDGCGQHVVRDAGGQLTQQIGINPNTIQKAYAELERQGIIYTLAGRGAFVSGDTGKLADMKRDEILRDMEISVAEAKKYFISRDAIENIIKKIYDTNNININNKGVDFTE